jgi:hypothetical protein
MARYLITGLPLSGLDDIAIELAARGNEVVNADEQFGYYGYRMSETPVTPPTDTRKLDRSWYADNGWLWDSARLRQLLLQPTDTPQFVVGHADNAKKFYRHFDRTFMLELPFDSLRSRLLTSDDPVLSNKNHIRRAEVWARTLTDQARTIGATMIVADRDPHDITDEIRRLTDAR